MAPTTGAHAAAGQVFGKGRAEVSVGPRRRELSAFSDVFLAVVSYLILVRVHVGALTADGNWYTELVPIIIALWWLLSVMIRRDVSYRLGGVLDEVRESIVLNVVGAVVVFALSLGTKHLGVSRLVIAGFPLAACLMSIALRLTVRAWLAARRSRGRDVRQVLIVGPAEQVPALAAGALRREAGMRPIGLLLPPGSPRPDDCPLPILGDYGELAEVLHSRVVDQIAVTAAVDDPGFRLIVETAIREGKTIWVMLDAFGSRLMGRTAPGQVVVLAPPGDSLSLGAKRVLDIAISAVGLFLTAPVMLVAAIAIKLDDPAGPVIFRQRRVGLHGREFTCLKFRSMVADAESRRQALLGQNEMDGPVFKIRRDPRITAVGRVLRKYSLDEIPQLWNVLRGDMSLVGPRPPLPAEVREYQPDFRRRLALRPGLTCLWQISGRNNVDFATWMELDLRYIDNWSFWLDLVILLRTIPTVLFGSGV